MPISLLQSNRSFNISFLTSCLVLSCIKVFLFISGFLFFLFFLVVVVVFVVFVVVVVVSVRFAEIVQCNHRRLTMPRIIVKYVR